MRLIVSLLILGCIVSPASGQWVYTTIQMSGLDSIHSIRYHSPNHAVYLGGNGKLIAVDAGTPGELAGITLPGPVDLTCSITAGNKLYCASLHGESLWVVDCATNQFTRTVSLDGRAGYMCCATGSNKVYVSCPSDSLVDVIGCATNRVVAKIDVPSWPSALCYNPELNRMYIAKSLSDEVAVIDCSTDTVVSTIWVRGVGPTDICYDSVTNCVYTANHTSGTVSIIDCARDSLVRVATVDAAPERVMTGPQGKVYCGGYSDSVLVVVESLGTRIIPAGLHLSSMSFDPVSQKVYCAMTDSEVVVVDRIGDTVVARVRAGKDLRFTCYDPVDTSTWAVRVKAATIGVLDDASDQLIGTLSFPILAPGAMCYSPVSNQLYCLAKCENDLTNRLIVIDGDYNRVLKVLPAEISADSIKWNPSNNKVYISNSTAGTVSILDCASDSITATVQTADSPSAMCCSGNGKVYVTIRGGVTVIDPGRDSIRAVVPTPYDPTSLCYDRTDNKVYAVLGGRGEVCVIDAGSDSLVATVPVAQSSQQVCWNQNHDKVYVCAPADSSVAVIDCSSDTALKSIDFGYWHPFMGYSDSACDKVCVCAGYGYGGFAYLYNIAAAFDTFRWVPGFWFHNVGCIVDNGKSGQSNRLYCADCTDPGELYVISGAADSVLRSVQLGDSPTALAWNSIYSWVYVANSGSSSISVVSDTMLGVEEDKPQASSHKPQATIVRGTLMLPWDMTGIRPGISDRVPRPILLDISGRKVMDLRPGANDVRALAPGVYFVREAQAQAQAVRKVVVTR